MEKHMNLKFGELRKYISVIDRVGICFRETQQYESYQFIREIPESYNDYFVYGIGMIDSEYLLEDINILWRVYRLWTIKFKSII